MARYRLETSNRDYDTWYDTGERFNTKKQLEDYIGDYMQEGGFEWRVGYLFKPVDCSQNCRFVWDSGKKKGEIVNV